MAKKPTKAKTRNPIATAVRENGCFRLKVEKSTEDKIVRDDRWNRKSKYKQQHLIDPDG